MNYWLIRLYRREDGAAEPLFAAAYIVGVPADAVAKDSAKSYSYLRDSPHSGYPDDDEPRLAAIMAEGHCALIVGMETCVGWSSEATAKLLDGSSAPSGDAFPFEGLFLWQQETGDVSSKD